MLSNAGETANHNHNNNDNHNNQIIHTNYQQHGEPSYILQRADISRYQAQA